MDRFSFLNALHAEFIDDLYEKYKKYPDSVEPSWRTFFQGFDFGRESYNGYSVEEISQQSASEVGIPEHIQKEFKVIQLINAYRVRGHLFTKTNPVRARRTYSPTLDLETFGLSQEDLDKSFDAAEVLGLNTKRLTLREIIDHLKSIYSNSIGVEYTYISNPLEVKWVRSWLNKYLINPVLKEEERRQILHKLNEAVAFESFLHKKFVGQKRFSVEGNEAIIPALDEIINRSADQGLEEVVVGMAHRGRLNVLANIFRKSYSQIFSEFDKKDFEEEFFDGDVKYHLGSTALTETANGKKIKINLAPNPSHLETVDAVVEGISRAKIDHHYNNDSSKVLPIVLHGDAAIAGQGIIYEVIQMEKLDGYKTGGTIHIVINNQIGFTTNYLDGRSSTYSTDIAKVCRNPVLHVNADDVEAVIHAVRFAVDYRNQFKSDVFIDLLGYRKYGHNEGDEPRFTQPKLYKAIAAHQNVREIYKETLKKKGTVGKEFIEEMEADFKSILENHFDESKKIEKNTLGKFMPEIWDNYKIGFEQDMLEAVDTTYPEDKLKVIAQAITELPEGKKFIRKEARLHDQRRKMVFEDDKIDWGMAELMAYGSLLDQKFDVRVSGEDVERGTFSHRHAVVKTEEAEEEFILLNHISDDQGRMQIYNSLLSEYAVLGFDYGYAMASPKTLTIWEAQFGDFANGAQIVIDQYISAAEDKWKIQNGLVMLLPHGYEGQGAEHSSARVERFLQLCAQGNMFVANCTTPANFYHLLRRQMLTNYRKPLVVFTPKSLLRHPKVNSTLKELSEGSFQTFIDDDVQDKKQVKRLVFCTGKLYYDLLSHKEEKELGNEVALVRMEQLYPIDQDKMNAIIKSYPKDVELVWAQEEPENMGAWSYILMQLREYNWKLISPRASAAPATGSFKRWTINQANVINKVFNLNE